MAKRYQKAIRFSRSKRLVVEAEFTDAGGRLERRRDAACRCRPPDEPDPGRGRGDGRRQAAPMRDRKTASPSTLCRFERRSSPAEALALRKVLFEQIVAAHPAPPRRMVVKAEHTDLGANTRFIVTNLDMDHDPQGLDDNMYCERGEMENRVKDQ